ncbi:MAG: sporulation protein [Armatimonadia bacterium]|nr:sporulation protein [Armatimonadia bacterium]
MEFDPTEQMNVIASEVRNIAQTETVIGEPIQAGDATIVPVISVAIGFGAGGGTGGAPTPGEGTQQATGTGGGGGAGISLTPIAFLVVSGDDIRLLPVKETALGGIAAALPRVVETILDRNKAGKGDEKEDEDADGDDKSSGNSSS